MSADAPKHKVLKIKPPLTFTKEMLFYLQKIVAQEVMKKD
jgi:4-aminobutyrate aminotransferase-like enzyme